MDEPAVLIVDDDVAMCQWLETTLVSWGMRAKHVTNPLLVPDEVEKNIYNLVLLDMFVPEMRGLDLLPRLRELCPRTKVIIMMDAAEPDAAIAALRRGAFDFFEKSAPMDFLAYAVQRALHIQRMEEEHRQALADLQRRMQEPQAEVARFEALTQELKEANQAVLVLARNIEEARRDAEARLMMQIRSLLLPLIRSLRQEREMARYVAQLGTILEFIEENPESLATNASLVTTLSASELRIALMIKDGLTSDEIAMRLHISPETVKSHRKNIRKKLGLRGSAERLRAYFESLGDEAAERAQR
jgi:DNA-binding NarL/FixJ family response regulator